MVLGDLETDREAKSGTDSDSLGGKARIKDALQVFGRDPDAVVGNSNIHYITFPVSSNRDFALLLDGL